MKEQTLEQSTNEQYEIFREMDNGRWLHFKYELARKLKITYKALIEYEQGYRHQPKAQTNFEFMTDSFASVGRYGAGLEAYIIKQKESK